MTSENCEPFPGLERRLAVALHANGIDDIGALRREIRTGKGLQFLDGIGPAYAKRILYWLDYRED